MITYNTRMRLFIVTILSFIITAAILLALRLVGLNTNHLERKHSFFDNNDKTFSVLGDSKLANYPSLTNMVETKKKFPHIHWVIPLYVEKDRLVAKAKGSTIHIEQILTTFPNDFYFFQIMENKENINFLLNEAITNFDLGDRVLLFSPFRNVISQVRSLRPKWLSALSTTEANFFYLSHKLWLETLASFPADFLWLDKDHANWLHAISAEELKRRKKFAICEASIVSEICLGKVTDSPSSLTTD